MKTTAIARIRQIRQSLFARFAGVQASSDHAPVSERKSAAVRHLYRILNNDSNAWVPTQVVADRSSGLFASLRRGVSRRVSALTIRNPFSEESLERTKRAFAFAFIETSLEKRQLLTTTVTQIGSSTNWLITISDTSSVENANITNDSTQYIVSSDVSVVGGPIPLTATSIKVDAPSSANAISFTFFPFDPGNIEEPINTAVNITSNIDVTNLSSDINASGKGSITISSANISGGSLTTDNGNSITLVGTVTGGTLNISTGTALVLPTLSVSELNVTSSGAITQTGPANVTGRVSFTSTGTGSAGNITLLNPGNDFVEFTASGTNITVYDSNNITFGYDNVIPAITATGDFRFNQGMSCITVKGPIDLTGGSGSVNLTGRNIIVEADISTAAGDIRLIGNNGTYQTGEFAGVQMTVTPNGLPLNVNTTGGNIVIDGRGGVGGLVNDISFGVVIAGSTVQAGGNGCLTITGLSDGLYGIYSSQMGDNTGPGIDWTVSCPNTFTTSNGSITINGIGGGERRCFFLCRQSRLD